ncbi:MAG: restriction endonuclease subunit S, partial [Segetibacter sp.]
MKTERLMIDEKVISAQWQIKKLGELCEIVSGNTPKGLEKVSNKGEHQFYKVSDMNLEGNETSMQTSNLRLTEEEIRRLKIKVYPKGTVIFPKRGGAILTNKKRLLSRPSSFDLNVMGILPNENVESSYLYYWFQKLDLTKIYDGSNVPQINNKNIAPLSFPLPSIKEQRQIVSKIEELFSELDKGIEEIKTAQQQLKVYRQAVLKWAFEGKLTNEDVNEGELPKGWKQVKTKDVIDIINNGYTPTKEFLSEGSGEVPFIKVYNLNFDGTLNFAKNPTFIPATIHQKELKRSICLPGDVLINIVGPPLGKLSIVTNQYPEWNINQAIVMFRPNEKVLSKYLAYFLQNPVTINWLEGTSKATAGQWNVKVSTCREIPFPICSIEEQQHIVQEVESRLSVCDKIEETITNS